MLWISPLPGDEDRNNSPDLSSHFSLYTLSARSVCDSFWSVILESIPSDFSTTNSEGFLMCWPSCFNDCCCPIFPFPDLALLLWICINGLFSVSSFGKYKGVDSNNTSGVYESRLVLVLGLCFKSLSEGLLSSIFGMSLTRKGSFLSSLFCVLLRFLPVDLSGLVDIDASVDCPVSIGGNLLWLHVDDGLLDFALLLGRR